MLKDTRSYEVQIIDAVRAVNRALGGTYGTSSAIGKTEFNQYEVQLIDAIKGIGRTLSGKGLSLAGGAGAGDLSGYATIAQFQDLSRRVSILEDESFFRLVDGNITLKPQYQNLWVPGWLAAGGVGSGSGGGSVDHLSDIGDVEIDPDTLANGQGIVWDSTLGVWKNANVGGGGGSGSVTSVNVTVPTGLRVAGVPITSSGTIAISYASGYKIPTTSKQNSWDAKQDAISDLSTIRTNASHGQTAYGWGDHSQAGYLTSETDPTVPAWAKAQTPSLYVGTTQVQTSSNAQDLTGILSVKATSSLLSKFVWDGNNDAWHFLGNLYADGWVSAGGIGSSGSGGASYLSQLDDVYHTSGSGVLRADGTPAVAGDALVYNSTHGWLAAPVSGGGSGTVTGIKMNGSTLSPSSAGIVDLGTVITSLSGYATEQWVGQQGYLTSYTETDPTVPAWAKNQNPLLYIGYTSVQTTAQAQYLFGIPYINATNVASSPSRIIWDAVNNAWHFYGNVYADGWVSAGGIGSGGAGGSVVSIDNLLSSGTRIATITIDGDDYDILAPTGGAGTVSSIMLGSTSYSPVNGVVSLPAYPTTLPASDVYSWAKASSKPSYSLSEISGTDDLQAIEALSGTSGLLRKTGSNTWSLDTTNYLSSHQTIYKLTLNAGSFTAGDYTPNSSAKTFNIPTSLDHIADGTNRKLSDYVTLGTTQTITGAKTFTTNPVTIGQTSSLSVHESSHIDIGPLRIEYDATNKALHITKASSSDTNTYGIYADGFVSACGVQ